MKRPILILISIGILFSLSAFGQIRPMYDRGAVGLAQMLKRLNTSASVLMIGAHPDDEDTGLLSYLARGDSARTAYLSLTRGDGGQNILGNELGEALGVIRTEELIQARKLDGAEQYFTRAYDYGFSKTLSEAKEKWDEKIVLCDVVRVIREFRPLVVVSQFSGTPADGHGQHQYAGYISPLAVKAAADAGQCTTSGDPWQVRKFYLRHRGQGEPRLRINTGKYDPIFGRSYFEIAMEARSQHRSQEQGVLERRGEQTSNLNLAGSEAKETGIFDGLDVSIAGFAKGTRNAERPVGDALTKIADAASKASGELDYKNPEKILPHLVSGYAVAAAAQISSGDSGAKAFFERKANEFSEAIKLAAGIQIDALADRETVVAGDSFPATVRVFVGEKGSASKLSAKIVAPENWTVTNLEPPKETPNQGFFQRETGDLALYCTIGVPAAASPTQPYWLREPRDGDLFRWHESEPNRTLPFSPPIPVARVEAEVFGVTIPFLQPIEYRYADDTRGEIRRFLSVVPKMSVDLDQPLLIVPTSDKAQTRKLVMSVTNLSAKPLTGTVGLNINADTEWRHKANSHTFNLKKNGERSTVDFDVTIPANTKPGSYSIIGQAMVGEALGSTTMSVVTYPHMQTHRIYRRAMTEVRVLDLKVAPVKIGYLAGSGDRVPEAIRQMGFNIELLSEKQLASGDLSMFDVIVVGIRASEVRADFAANNQRLLEYARAGGMLVVQYQRPVYSQQGLLPYPAQITNARVADENAPVRVLMPEHPILNFPNKITDADFSGWVQERNLYNFATMDAKYTGLLESHDTGEAENMGGLVIADVGKGKYVYTSYSFFRQLPAGVGGAYRLFANILSLPKSKKS